MQFRACRIGRVGRMHTIYKASLLFISPLLMPSFLLVERDTVSGRKAVEFKVVVFSRLGAPFLISLCRGLLVRRLHGMQPRILLQLRRCARDARPLLGACERASTVGAAKGDGVKRGKQLRRYNDLCDWDGGELG